MFQPERRKESMDATQILAPDADGVQRAVALLRAAELVAFPTETV
jgi:tRNA A37 threonylcarbamoyladenosine synthetase subunit TsaC/SUA5/YrdC